MTASEIDYAVWHKYMQDGKSAYEVGRYSEAERILSMAVKEAEKFGSYDGRLLESLKTLADFYTHRGEASIARSLIQRALRIALGTVGPDDKLVAELQSRLGTPQASPKYDSGHSTLVWC